VGNQSRGWNHWVERPLHGACHCRNADHCYCHGEERVHSCGPRHRDFDADRHAPSAERKSGDGDSSTFGNKAVFRAKPGFRRDGRLVTQPYYGKHHIGRYLHGTEHGGHTDDCYCAGEQRFYKCSSWDRHFDSDRYATSSPERDSGDCNRSAFRNTAIFRAKPTFRRDRRVVSESHDGRHRVERPLYGSEHRCLADHRYCHGEELLHSGRLWHRYFDPDRYASTDERESGNGDGSTCGNTAVDRAEPALRDNGNVVA